MNINRVQKVIREKKSKICLAADVKSVEELLEVADKMGPDICILKIHYDIIPDFQIKNCSEKLLELKNKHNFLVWEDRKYADIGSIMERQIRVNVLPWADLVSVHPIPGLESINAIPKEIGIILIGEMSCYGNLSDWKYIESVTYLSKELTNCIGIVGQRDLKMMSNKLMFVPGISLSENSGDTKGQRYNTMKDRDFADVFVVGRSILNSSNPLETLKKFKTEAQLINNTSNMK